MFDLKRKVASASASIRFHSLILLITKQYLAIVPVDRNTDYVLIWRGIKSKKITVFLNKVFQIAQSQGVSSHQRHSDRT